MTDTTEGGRVVCKEPRKKKSKSKQETVLLLNNLGEMALQKL